MAVLEGVINDKLDPSTGRWTPDPRKEMFDRLFAAADDDVKSAALLILHISQMHPGQPVISQFLARAVSALDSVVAHADLNSIRTSVTARSDVMVLLTALESPEVLSALAKSDPLIEPHIRGALSKRWLLEEEGGAVNGEELANLLSITRQAVDARRNSGKLLALTMGNRKYLYPLWQIREGEVLPGLDQVLAALDELGPWPKAQFMLEQNKWLDWETPLNRLRDGEINQVVTAAERLAD